MTPSFSNGPSGKRPDLSKLPDFNLDDIDLDDIELFEQDFDDIDTTKVLRRSEQEALTREYEFPEITTRYSALPKNPQSDPEALDARYSRAFGDSMPPKHNGKRIALIVGGVVLVLLLAVVGVEAGFNAGRIHRGVSVNGIDVGGMKVEDATAKIDSELESTISAIEVDIVPDDKTAARLGLKVSASEAGATDSTSSDVAGSVASTIWAVDAKTLGVSFDGAELAEKAFAVGRGSDFFKGRIDAWLHGVEVGADLTYDETLVDPMVKTIDSVIGIPMVNGTISVSADGTVGVVPGSEGECVNPDLLRAELTEAFLSGRDSEVKAPMMVEVIDIDEAEAAAVAKTVQAAIAQPITFTYESGSWEATSASLGSWIKARVDGVGDKAVLVPYVDVKVAEPGIQKIMGDVGYGEAVDAYFDVSSGKPVIAGGTEGIGPDIKGGVKQLNDILFGAGGARTIAFVVGTVQPEITVADAQAMGVTELIVTYKLNYGASGGDTRMFNIERALDLLNASKGSLVAPGENWGWHAVIGNCSYETGFLGAGALVDGVRVIEEGGGICNVASAVFNAAYEAGLPIVERHNHSIYMQNYPLGRDATVSWPSPDMIFKNDTQHYILVTARYDGNNMWISIWGTSEDRSVTSESFWSGTNRVINYRNVYDANGKLLIGDTFVSTFRTPEATPTTPETPTTPVTPVTPVTPETPTTPTTPETPTTTP